MCGEITKRSKQAEPQNKFVTLFERNRSKSTPHGATHRLGEPIVIIQRLKEKHLKSYNNYGTKYDSKYQNTITINPLEGHIKGH